jgi:hypothetical protein
MNEGSAVGLFFIILVVFVVAAAVGHEKGVDSQNPCPKGMLMKQSDKAPQQLEENPLVIGITREFTCAWPK